MKLTFDNSEVLDKLIKDVYFSNIQGKKNNYIERGIKLTKEDLYYRILSNLDYNIKLSNDIIDGHMIFTMEEHTDNECILLYPTSMYCIEREGKYVFY